MIINERPFSPIDWGGQDPHGVTTGWHQQLAGSGRHSNYSEQRWAQERARAQQGPVPLRPVASPLGGEAPAFAQEIVAAEASRPRLGARLVGGVLGYQLARAALRNRGMR
jgi:hypothetical protein